MIPIRTRHRLRTATVLAASLLFLGGCSQGGFDPRGPEAARIHWVFWALMIASTAVTVLVVGLWLWGALRSGRDDVDTGEARLEHGDDSRLGRRFVIGGGIVMPAVIMAGFFGVQLVTTAAQSQAEGELVIEVTGHQYWWQLDYSGIDGVEDFATANEVHVPTGTEVKVKLRSDDVIHSFWVPQVSGKVDLVPGRPAEFVLQADDPGTYPGYCAEYCGSSTRG